MNVSVPPSVPLRAPDKVMRLARMGAMFPSRLSFLRTLMRFLSEDNARVTRPLWEMDADGYGHAVYSVDLGGYTYSLVAVSNALDPLMRTDRVIAQAWDAAFVLFDGVPNDADIARILTNAPLQEAGRFSDKELVLSRANKSVRLFEHVTTALKNGTPLNVQMIRDIGYLMRTTAVYGNGKFGISDRAKFADRPGLDGPFMAEMLTVWLIRGFTHDLAEHVGGAPLPRALKRHLGIGNSTGLGMAPFLVSHPEMLNNWMMARETALARVRALSVLAPHQIDRLLSLSERAANHLDQWRVPDQEHQARIDQLREDWTDLIGQMPDVLSQTQPLDQLVRVSEVFSVDCQELVVSLAIEPFGDIVDGLACCMGMAGRDRLDPSMDVSELRDLVAGLFSDALAYDFNQTDETAQFWYVSAEKLEPRLGLRHEEPGADMESPLDVARAIQSMYHDAIEAEGTVGAFLRVHPAHRWAVTRVQRLKTHPFAEIRDNLICADCKPIDMLRCKLSFFGAAKFDPKSNLWTRITLAQGAPLFDELSDADDWWMPVFEP